MSPKIKTGEIMKAMKEVFMGKNQIYTTSFSKVYPLYVAKAPQMNPNRALIKGVICGVRVENIEEPLMREIRYLDKLIDELAKGKAMEKILRE